VPVNAEPVSATIQVDMDVESYEVFREDGMVQLWGRVGDYEVSLWLPLDDARVKRLLRPQRNTR
jgi:hypothetical protein